MPTNHSTLAALVLSLLIMIIYQGCAAPQQAVRTEYVATPTFCKVTMPARPQLLSVDSRSEEDNYNRFLSNLKALLIYTDELEMALQCCTNGTDCLTKERGGH